MTTYMQEEIDVDAIPRKTDVPVCTTMTRLAFSIKDKEKEKAISRLHLSDQLLKWTPHIIALILTKA